MPAHNNGNGHRQFDLFEPRAPKMLTQARPGETLAFSGEVLNVRYHDKASGFFVADIRHGVDRIAVTGNTMFLQPGTKVAVSGQWENNARYGMQLKASSIALTDHSGAMKLLLASGFLSHIKAHMAEVVSNTFGAETFAKLDEAIEDPNRLRVVKGIGPINCHAIVDSWKKERHWAQSALLSIRVGLNMRQAKDAWGKFGHKLEATINDNPYLLTQLHGISWQRADEIAALEWPGKQKIDHDDPKRYVAALREVLKRAYVDGDMALTEEDALTRAEELAKPTMQDFREKTIQRCLNQDEGIIKHEDYLYLEAYYRIERDTADQVAAMISKWVQPIGDWSAIEAQLSTYTSVDLSPDQVEAVRQSLTNRLLVITGGPGTGKTTILKTICNIMAHHRQQITLCAPTGKAARRMAEATDRSAATIHRTLRVSMEGESENSFDTDVALIDEASMIDAALMRTVVKACGKRTRLILIGDVDQLPPVGAGEPFYQIIQSGAPVVRLTNIHRQGKDSGIIWAAHSFNAGIVPDVTPFSDIKIMAVPGNDYLPKTIMQYVDELITAKQLTIDDVTVLTPLNNYDWGQYKLNLNLQERYNPGDFPLRGCHFKQDDKVIHIKNVYRMRDQTILNGMTGKIIWVMSSEEERIEDARRKQEGISDLPIVVKVQFDGEPSVTTYTREELGFLKLAYAMTIHKSQGSEYGYVVMATPMTNPNFMMRQLAYTGLTRAKKYCVIISASSALRNYVENEERVRRVTFLAWMIQWILQREVKYDDEPF